MTIAQIIALVAAFYGFIQPGGELDEEYDSCTVECSDIRTATQCAIECAHYCNGE